MKYRFLLTNRDGESGSFEWPHSSAAKARQMATSIVHDVAFIQSAKVYLLTTDDSCGPSVCISTVNRKDL